MWKHLLSVCSVFLFCGVSYAAGEVSANACGMTVALPNGVKLELVKVEAGTFTMGSPSDEEGRWVNETQHRVTLTRDFYLGKTEVTQAQWRAVMGYNPSRFKGDDLPVEWVSWDGAMAFCKKLNDMGLAPKGWKFTLPTEAQWEYAARGGNRSRGFKYSGSNNLSEVAWYYVNSGDNRLDELKWSFDSLQSNRCKTHPVAGLQPNELGLYDMSGNVSEWCLDGYEKGYARDPEFLAGNSGSCRVTRGGGFDVHAKICRSARRDYYDQDGCCLNIGLRVALVKAE